VCAALALAIGLLVQATAARAQNERAGQGRSDDVGETADAPIARRISRTGEKQRDESPTGAICETTRLDGAALKQTISCGRPGTGMPAFSTRAPTRSGPATGKRWDYSERLYPTPRTLTPDEIDAVVTYLQARIVGKGRIITKQECLYYYADQPDWCDDYK